MESLHVVAIAPDVQLRCIGPLEFCAQALCTHLSPLCTVLVLVRTLKPLRAEPGTFVRMKVTFVRRQLSFVRRVCGFVHRGLTFVRSLDTCG